MMTAAIFVSLFFVCALLSRRLSETLLTTPILFTAAGMLISPALVHVARAGVTPTEFLRVAELGLVLLLFIDASRTDLNVLRSIGTLPILTDTHRVASWCLGFSQAAKRIP